jgi:lysophospholipase L1-like esterase
MKNFFLSALVLCAVITSAFMTDKKVKVVFFGDSITEAGIRPNGFITIDDSLLNPPGHAAYDLIGAGISGNKVYDLYLRVEDDVIRLSPDVVVVWIGVNDVWHKKMGTGTDADKFEKFYIALIKKFKAAKIRVVVCTPATIGEKYDNTNEQDGDLNKYANIIRKIAADENLTLVDMRKEFEEYEKLQNTKNLDRGLLTADGVHLNDMGNQFVARLMAEGIRKTF